MNAAAVTARWYFESPRGSLRRKLFFTLHKFFRDRERGPFRTKR